MLRNHSASRACGTGPVVHDAATVEHDNSIGEISHIFKDVARQQDRRSAEPAQQPGHRDALTRIQPGARLVQQQDLCAGGQRLR